MLTQLTTLKARLGLGTAPGPDDTLLTNALEALSVRFDNECQRTLARTVGATEEFNADDTEIRVACYPLESLSKFEVLTTEAEGWVERTGVDFLVRRGCVISLPCALGTASQQARVTYTGGYVLPGTTPGAGQTPLPADLEQAAVEQAACWYLNRDKLGLVRQWPSGGAYLQFAQLDLLLEVKAVLRRYERWVN
jgi:hypothetical protein